MQSTGIIETMARIMGVKFPKEKQNPTNYSMSKDEQKYIMFIAENKRMRKTSKRLCDALAGGWINNSRCLNNGD